MKFDSAECKKLEWEKPEFGDIAVCSDGEVCSGGTASHLYKPLAHPGIIVGFFAARCHRRPGPIPAVSVDSI